MHENKGKLKIMRVKWRVIRENGWFKGWVKWIKIGLKWFKKVGVKWTKIRGKLEIIKGNRKM